MLSVKARALSMTPSPRCLVAVLASQRLHLFEQGEPAGQFVMSSSRAAPSNRQDSGGSPPGLHEICEIIGTDAPAGTVFRGRGPVAGSFRELPPEEQAGNLITSRILRLRGLEPGVNAGEGIDSYQRYIYLHGTHRPARLGSPFSGGCLLLSDPDIITLATWVAVGSQLLILPAPGPGITPVECCE